MSLNLYSSNRLEILVDELARVLRTPLASPLASEIIMVQSRGMERWVSLELARRHGVCANLRCPFPNRFIREVFRHFISDLPEENPFDPAGMTWRIMGLLPSCLEKDGFQVLRAYLADDAAGRKRLQLSRRIAEVFDQYLIFRPEMILGWEKGLESHWQAALWRELAGKGKQTHPAALLHEFLAKAESGRRPADLPERVSLFGISALPHFHLRVLEAVSRHMEVNLFLMNPCREYWADIVSDREMTRVAGRQKKKDAGPAELYLEKGNSLLASMGALGRDFFALIGELQPSVSGERELFADAEERSLLSAIQSDILNLRDRGPDENTEKAGKTPLGREDGSIRIHACHSPMREVEVLQDQLLSLFAADPGLRPRDVLVMTPDVGAYAPFIQAVFSLPGEDARWIPFSIADRGLRQEGPLADALLKILDVRGSRFGAAQVMDILESSAVRKKFSLAEDDLELLHHWVRETGIRWGIDAASRGELGLPPFGGNTWRAGLDRMLLGYALAAGGEGKMFRDILPYDRIEGSGTAVLGNFVEFAERLFAQAAMLGEARTLEDWAARLTGILDSFFAPEGGEEREDRVIRQTLRKLADMQALSGFSEKVDLDIARAWLKEALDREGFGAGFLAGGVTFCAMLPMRSIPFKVICLIGMNDAAYPRQDRAPGFDLMAWHPRPGDRSRRKDDRYLFLETLLSAREILYISYVGRSVQDNSPRPPSVLVSELLDYIEQGFAFPEAAGDSGSVSDRIVTAHRLQAFSPAYFGKGNLFSYSEENFRAARSALAERREKPEFISSPLPSPDDEWKTVDLNALCRFFGNPAGYLCNRRLQISLGEDPAVLDEAEPFGLNPLERYGLRSDLLAEGLRGAQLRELYPAFAASDRLPHGTPGTLAFNQLCEDLEGYLRQLLPLVEGGKREPLDIDLTVGGFRVTGRVEEIYAAGLLHYRPAKARGIDRLRSWIHHLVLNHLGLGGRYPALLVCEDLACRYRPVAESGEYLNALLGYYWQGLLKPLHFFPRSSWVYAEKIRKGKSEDEGIKAARSQWEGYEQGEKDDPYFRFCFRGAEPLDSEFKTLAAAIFGPLFDYEEKV